MGKQSKIKQIDNNVLFTLKIRPCHKRSMIALPHTHTLLNKCQEHYFSLTQLELLRQITLAIFTFRKNYLQSLKCVFLVHYYPHPMLTFCKAAD